MLLLCVLVSASALGSVPKQDQVTSSPRDLEQLVKKVAGPLVDGGLVMGLSAVVICGDTTAMVNLGRTDKDRAGCATSATEYQIGSITKVFTCLALARLVENGTVRLQEPIEALLPAGTDVPSSGTRRITVADLATHSSGLPRMPSFFMGKLILAGPDDVDNPYASITPTDMLAGLRKQRLYATPGEKWEYSNLGMGLLGFALTARTGRSYEAMLRELVLNPLHLNDTATTLSARQQKNVARGYTRVSLLGMLPTWHETTTWSFTDAYAGAGALYSTPADMLRFLHFAMDPPPTPVGAAMRMAQEPRFTANAEVTMGLGWLLLRRPQFEEPVYFHNGGTGGYSSFLAFDRPSRTGAVILCNTSSDDLDDIGFSLLSALRDARGDAVIRPEKPRP